MDAAGTGKMLAASPEGLVSFSLGDSEAIMPLRDRCREFGGVGGEDATEKNAGPQKEQARAGH